MISSKCFLGFIEIDANCLKKFSIYKWKQNQVSQKIGTHKKNTPYL